MSASGLQQNPMVVNHFIAGEFAGSDERIVGFEPSTNQQLSKIARGKHADINSAVDAAIQAFPAWSEKTNEERAFYLEAMANIIEEELDEFAVLESRDTGKPLWLTRTLDIPRAVANFRFFAGAIRHSTSEFCDMAAGAAINYTQRKPIGVIGCVTPWNLPIYQLTWKVAPALVMGNTVVAKPSELSPLTATKLGEVAQKAGLPAGVLNIIHGYGAEAGQALVEHPSVKAISFTGGTATGQIVAKLAAPMFKKMSLELGGKNPTVVFADCDFETTVDGVVRSAYLNQGEICLCGSRVFVERPLFDKFVDAFKKKIDTMVVGDPADPQTFMGALISREHKEKVKSYIELARTEGGTVYGCSEPELLGECSEGYFLRPGFVTGLDPLESRTAQEEIFGPFVTIHPFDTVDEVIRFANSVRYGLAASVWTSNLGIAHSVAGRLDVGMVWVNCWLMRDLRVPFGGVKDSGIGREGGWNSLHFFSESKNVCVKIR